MTMLTLGIGMQPCELPGVAGADGAYLARESLPEVHELVEVLRWADTDGRAVLAVHPAVGGEAVGRRLALARALADVPRVVTYPSRLPPLAAGVLAALSAELAPHLASAGLSVAALPHLEGELTVLAWLGSVARLREPGPSLRQHLRSWLPRAAFLASYRPGLWVHAANRVLRDEECLPQRYGRMGVAVAAHGGDLAWVRRALLPRFAGAQVIATAPSATATTWWGTDRLVEVVGYPLDTSALAGRMLRYLRPLACRWCGEEIAGQPCPFCGQRQEPGVLTGEKV